MYLRRFALPWYLPAAFLSSRCLRGGAPAIPSRLTLAEAIRLALARNPALAALGGATLIDCLDAQRTYLDALRIYCQALFDERISVYELASAIGSGVEQ